MRVPGYANPVVDPVLSALPELDDLGGDPVATPVRGHRNVLVTGEAFGHLGELTQQLGTGADRAGLRRRPRAQL